MIAVLIATCDRPDLLAQRALTSVQRQSRPPDVLIVVDDSEPRNHRDNRNIVNDVRLPASSASRIVYLRNTRTEGASGAWNTGLEWLRRHERNAGEVFVAMLDDDDEWLPDHLKLCEQAADTRSLDMVAPGILRVEGHTEEHRQFPPAELDPDLFLIGNPHVQGSNLFVRLDALLEAGCFDESLRSTTDRDLCIRLADLGWVRYASLDAATVRHHAESQRPRLSSPAGAAKREGLDRFWAKWSGRMTALQRKACCDRAKALFGWVPPASPLRLPSPRRSYVPATGKRDHGRARNGDMALVAGIITGPGRTEQFARLLDQLASLQRWEHLRSLDVVVLHNGGPCEVLQRVIEDRRARGVSVFLASERQQAEDARKGVFGERFSRPRGRVPIGPARTMLQTYVTRVVRHRGEAVSWILDDDSNLENLVDGDEAPAFTTLLPAILEMRSLEVDVVLGAVTGDPPVPPGSSVRTQLVDLYHNLNWLLRLDPEAELPDRSVENHAARAETRDFYYDLSRRDTDHLERPFWLTPRHSGESVRSALDRMVAGLPRILAGQALFRPILLEPTCDPIGSLRPSVQRGANTFVFNPKAFEEFPNAAPEFAGSTLRRSDMMWALLNRYAGGRRIVSATVPVRHDRSSEPTTGLDLTRLIPDIHGYALYSAVEDVLIRRRELRLREGEGAETADDLQFTESDEQFTALRFRKYLIERTAALLLGCWRIQGLCKAILRVDGLIGRLTYRQNLRSFLDRTRTCFDLARVQVEVDKAIAVPDAAAIAFIRDLPGIVARHKQASTPPGREDAWFRTQREAAARALAVAVAQTRDLRLLGTGGEGVVYASGDWVIKVLDHSGRSPANGARTGVGKLATAPVRTRALYRPMLVAAPNGRQVITYPFEPSGPYDGGRVEDLLRLIRECREAGIVTTNLHPKNLRVTSKGVRFVDYGADIHPHSPGLYATMVQRVWLTLRHHDRADLPALMRDALRNESLPELEGWEALLAAVDAPGKKEVVDDPLFELICQWNPRRVLDYGCGSGQLAAALACRGAAITAYDPNDDLRQRWTRYPMPDGSTVRWLAGRSEAEAGILPSAFDVVVCSLVLCVIEDEPEYQGVLQAVSRALEVGGRFVVLVCNPQATLEGDSTLQRRILPVDPEASGTFSWEKQLPSGNRRIDVHRPLAKLAGDMAEAGLRIETTFTTGGLDLATMTPSRDYLILSGRKHGSPVGGSPHGACEPDSGSVCVSAGRAGQPPVLCYHRVLPRNYDDAVSRFQRRRGTVVDLELFLRQLKEIRSNWTPVSLERYVAWLDGGTRLPANACLLTFDDGYRDFTEHVLPALIEHELPGVLFATLAAAKGEELLPTDALYAALARAEQRSCLSAEQIQDWTTGTNKKRYVSCGVEEQRLLLEEAGLCPPELAPHSLYLDERELAHLPPSLVAIGGHGWRHELLGGKDLPWLRAELRKVQFWLEHLNAARGHPRHPPTLAYPSGSHDPLVRAAVIEAQFRAAFTVEPGRSADYEHRWRLSRACIPNRPDAIARLASGEALRI